MAKANLKTGAILVLFAGAMGVGIRIPAETTVPVDLHGDPLPAGTLARLGTMRFYHENGFNVAYSANGKVVASAGEGVVRLWDAATGHELGHFPGDRGFALSPDGSRLASSETSFPQRWLVLWDTVSGKHLHRWEGHQEEIFALTFSPDGKLLATGDSGGTIRLWDTIHGKNIGLLTEEMGSISALAFLSDGRTLISGGHLPSADGTMRWGEGAMTRIWEVSSRKERQRFPKQAFAAISSNGRVMAMTSEKYRVLQLLSLTGKTLLTLKDFAGEGNIPRDINSVCFSPDGKIVATACRGDSAIRLWDAKSGKALRTITLAGYVFSVAFAPDGKSLAVGVPWAAPDYNRIRFFDPATGREKILQKGRMDAVHTILFLPDGKSLANTSTDNTFRLWQAGDGKAVRAIQLNKVPRAIAPDGALVAVSGLGNSTWAVEEILELRDTTTGKIRHKLEGHRGGVAQVAWAPDGTTMAVATRNSVVLLWDAATGKLRKGWRAPATWSLVFSPDGKTLATGDLDCTVQLWQAASGQFIRRLGMPLEREKFHRPIIAGTSSIAFSPDGKSVAAALVSENTIHLWNAVSGEELCRLKGHAPGWGQGWIYTLAFSPDGKTLFSGSKDRTIRLWDTASGKERSRLQGHRGSVSALALSADGTRLASGSQDGTGLIWDLTSSGK